MKNIIIETEEAGSKESLHLYIKDAFDLPDYYGNNLDALYDCLTSISEYITIIIPPSFTEVLDGYGSRIVRVFEDASHCNEYLHLQFKESI